MNNYDKLRFENHGEITCLPTWCATWSDDEIENAKSAIIKETEEMINMEVECDEEDCEEMSPEELKRLFIDAGFTNEETEMIIVRIENGYTIDNAIDTICGGNEYEES